MRKRSLVLAAALVATAAAAEDEAKPAEHSNQPPTADTQRQDPKDPKSYGYGEQPGREAKESSARQSADPRRPPSKTPQDERPAPGRTEDQGASVAGRVVSVSKDSVSVRGDDRKEQSLAVTPRTVVLREGQRIDVSRLQPGDEVRASIERQGERRVATRITVQGADSPAQQGTMGRESVDTPDQEREGIGGRMEESRPDPEKGGPEGPPSGR